MGDTLLLGSNTFSDNNGTIVIKGKEVFRLRRRQGNNQLVADFDVRGPNGEVLATVRGNNVVQAAEGMKVDHGPDYSEVVNARGEVVVRAAEVAQGVVRVTGVFFYAGHCVKADEKTLTIDTNVLEGCSFNRLGGAAIRIE